MQEANIKQKNEKRDKKSLEKILIPIFIILATILVLLGIYRFYFSNPKRIMTNAITKFSNRVDNVFHYNKVDLGDNYTINGDVKINIESDMLSSLAASSTQDAQDALQYVKLMNNINKLSNKYTLVQDKNNQKILLAFDSKLGKNTIVNAQYIAQDKKQYILVKNFFDRYIDGGESNYFETLEENESQLEDLKYIYNTTIQSFNRNLKDSYFKTIDVTTKINGKDKKVKKISIIIDKNNIVELAENILNDLKKDKKANKILTKINSNFKNAKIDKDTFSLEDQEEIILSVYTDSLTYEELKYELNIHDKTNDVTITYEDGKEGIIEVLNKEKLLLQGVITSENNSTSIILKDANKKEFGKINATSKNGKSDLNVSLEYQGMKLSLAATNENTKTKDGFNMKGNMNIKAESNGTSLANIQITNTATATKEANINVKVENPIKELTEAQKNKAQTELTRVLATLMQ